MKSDNYYYLTNYSNRAHTYTRKVHAHACARIII
nr:MAG TPA: hypothetical protein [Microviridae sp.]